MSPIAVESNGFVRTAGVIDALAETTNGPYRTECVYGPDATGCDSL